MIVGQFELRFAIHRQLAIACFDRFAPVTDRVAEVRVVFMRQRKLVVLRRLRLADHQGYFEEPQAERMQHAVHVIDARLATLVEPVTYATLRHPETFGEYFLSDLEFTHLGLDQFYPFIHVRHDTWRPSPGKTQNVLLILLSQIRNVLG
ncbi:hypothetical protein D3C84_748880 [compost metagenome]